ncbi:MerR family transcriptional regulator [Actinotalea subterranea]|uniref:MerR family transcriptional regulator n=1 Tax=Actinotalea subterranea TaxID=2607497 RepID=UPI0011EBF2B9|nr:MerR family transcriptional regulator [Actinotalea subterranea]
MTAHTIETVAALTGMTPPTLRYYERIGLLAPVERDAAGRRRYSEGDLGMIGFVVLLRETGMPVREMTRFMELTRGGDGTIPARVALLREHRDAVRERLEREAQHLEAIEHKVGVYESMLAAPAPASVPDPAPDLAREARVPV